MPEEAPEKLPETPRKIYLKACSGVEQAGIPDGHIWKAVTKEQWSTREHMGWMTVEEAKERFGAENVVVTGSSTICASCTELIESRDSGTQR